MPVLDAGRAPDDVAGTDDLHGLAPLLRQPHAGFDHQVLALRMGMPIGAGAGFESDQIACGVDVAIGWPERINAGRLAREVRWGATMEARVPARVIC